MRIGFLGLLTLLFITLQLTHVIAWPWWLVLLPAGVGFVLGLVVLILAALAKQR